MEYAMTDHKALRLVDVLRDQRQCDEDGVMCIVSRQAVDEAVQIIESMTAAPASSEATINSDGIDSKLIDAASEGGDGAVAWVVVDRAMPVTVDGSNNAFQGCYWSRFEVESAERAERSRESFANSKPNARFEVVPLYTRPAAQASEGEDGAVAWQYRYRHQGPNAHVYSTFVHPMTGRREGDAEIEWWVYGVKPSRPAAQVAATPKHDEGRDLFDAAYEAAHEGKQGKKGVCRYWWNAALATQPAARRVTEQDASAFMAAFNCEAENSTGSRIYVHDLSNVRAALESLAQPRSVPDEGATGVPAEGVSGGSWDEDGDEEPCSFCLCRGCNGECGGDQL